MSKRDGKKGRYRLYKEWSAEDIVAAIDEWEHLQGMPHDEVHGSMNVDHLRKTFLRHAKNQRQLSQGYELLHYGIRKLYAIDYEALREWYRLSSASRHAKVRDIGAGSGERRLAANNAAAKKSREQGKRYSSGGATSNSAGVRPYHQKVEGWSLTEIDTLKKNYGNVPMDPQTWKLILPGKRMDEIHERARRMGLRQTRPTSGKKQVVPAAKGKNPVASATKSKKTKPKPSTRDRSLDVGPISGQADTRSWSDHDDDIIRAYYPKLGLSGARWPVWPKRRKPSEVRARATELGIDFGPKPSDDGKQLPNAKHLELDASRARRVAWAADLTERFYETYGPGWGQWKRIVPWMGRDDLKELAYSLGCDSAWSDESKLSFIENEGIDWTLEELNTLIELYPTRLSKSIDWELDLPSKSSQEREDLAKLLGLPTKGEIGDLARRARGL